MSQMSQDLYEDITTKSIVLDYLSGIGFTHDPLDPQLLQSVQVQQRLEQDLTAEVESLRIPQGDSDKLKLLRALIRTSCAMGAFAYPNHDYPVQLLISRLTLCTLYVDDRSSSSRCRNVSCLRPFLEFQRRFTQSPPQPQLDLVLDHFATALRDVYNYWNPISANAMVAAILEFVIGSCIENVTETEQDGLMDKVDNVNGIQSGAGGGKGATGNGMGLEINPNATDYPDFLRSKTGATQGFAFFIFPTIRSSSSPLSSNVTDGADGISGLRGFIQAIPSITKWANFTNDILSFHKEELAGETGNYIHLKAKFSKATNATHNGYNNPRSTSANAYRVAKDLVDESIDLAERIDRILSGNNLKSWLAFKTGFIQFHVLQERYRLLGLLETSDSVASKAA